jgi:hypothetical protein
MSQKIALLVSAALTVFVVFVAGALAMRLGRATPAITQAAQSAQMEPGEPEIVSGPRTAPTPPQHEPGALQQTAAHIRTLQVQLQQLQAQNATLLEREQIYQRRLQEANRLLQTPARIDSRELPLSSDRQQEARYTTDAETAAATRVTKRKRARHHNGEEEDDD